MTSTPGFQINSNAVEVVDFIEPVSDVGRSFHREFFGFDKTPLYTMPPLAEQLGVEAVVVKDESRRFGLPAFKILGASWAIRRRIAAELSERPTPCNRLALQHKCRQIGSVAFVTATDGNHGRAVARMAKLLEVPARIFIPDDAVEARVAGLRDEGADVEVVRGTYDDAVRAAAAFAKQRGAWLIQDTSLGEDDADVARWVIEGYATMFREIDEQLREVDQPGPNLVFVQVGVGALAAAVVHHYRTRGRARRARLVSVEPHHAACAVAAIRAGEVVDVPGPHQSIMAGLNCGRLASVAWPSLHAGVDVFMTIGDDASRDAMKTLASGGVESGESGAAGLAGLISCCTHAPREVRDAIGLGPSSRILIISTEGATDPVAYDSIVSPPPA